jgi:hypothetical protein
MPEGIKIVATFSSQLHCRLEGKDIPIGEILELDISLDFISSGILQRNSREVIKNRCPLNTSLSIWGKHFHPIGTKIVTAPLVTSSLKSLEDHLFHSKSFAYTMGNISKVF